MGNWLQEFIYRNWGPDILNWLRKMEPMYIEPTVVPKVMQPAKAEEHKSDYSLQAIGLKLLVDCIDFQVEIDTATRTAKVFGVKVLLESRSSEKGSLEKSMGLHTDFSEMWRRTDKHTLRKKSIPSEEMLPKHTFDVDRQSGSMMIDFYSYSVQINHTERHVIARNMYVEGMMRGRRIVWGYGKTLPKEMCPVETLVPKQPEPPTLTLVSNDH